MFRITKVSKSRFGQAVQKRSHQPHGKKGGAFRTEQKTPSSEAAGTPAPHFIGFPLGAGHSMGASAEHVRWAGGEPFKIRPLDKDDAVPKVRKEEEWELRLP
jgi:hypothetical protein